MALQIQNNRYLKTVGELPSHITHLQYLAIRELPQVYYAETRNSSSRKEYLTDRDRLLFAMLWETGGRVGDVVRITKQHIDFDKKILSLDIKKTKIVIRINLSPELCYEIMSFYNKHNKEPFLMTRINVNKLLQKYGKIINYRLHPHQFRHGLALFLLANNVSIPIVSYRLGHASTKTTMEFYMRVTPDIEKKFVENINFHRS